MSLGGHLLRHDLVVVRPTYSATLSDYNQPVATGTAETHLRGFLQSRNGRELRQANDVGAVASTHVAFFAPGADITAADKLYDAAVPGEVYQVRDVAVVNAPGRRHHIRADLNLVQG